MTDCQKSAWQCLNSREVYDNPWIKVTHDQVKRPNGSEGIYGRIHFKNLAIGVVALDVDTSGEEYVYLVRQSRYPLDCVTLELPEGGCLLAEPNGDGEAGIGEAPLQAAQRELREEVGLIARDWQPLMQLQLSNSVSDECAQIFVARGLEAGEQALEDTEDIEVVKLPLKTAVAKVLSGDIVDAISVAALLRVGAKYLMDT